MRYPTNEATTTEASQATQATMSKHGLAKRCLQQLQADSAAQGLDPIETLEALLTWSIQELQSQRGSNHARDYLQFELSSLGSGGMYDVQKR